MMAGQHGSTPLLPSFVAAEPRQAGGGDCRGKGYSGDGTDSADDLRLVGKRASCQSVQAGFG